MNLPFRKVLLAVMMSAVQSAGAATVTTDEALGRFVGTWKMDLMAHEESFGALDGPGTGTMHCAWGLMNAWVDCQMDSHYQGLGQYGLKIVLYRLRKDGEVGAFVTNSFGGGRLYEGAFNTDSELVFGDAWIDPARNWEYQRTIYRFDGSDRIDFDLTVSKDNSQYLPHSSGVYHRQ